MSKGVPGSALDLELRAALAKMELALGAVDEGIAWTDFGGLLSWCNPWLAELLRSPRVALLGRPLADVMPFGAGLRAIDGPVDPAAAARSGHARAGGVYEWTRDGETAWLEIRAFRAELASGSASAVLVVRDVSRQKASDELLRRRTAELERSNQDLEQFAHLASHDLQEPLRKVAGYLGLLKNGLKGRLRGAQAEYLDIAVGASTRMTRMIDDLLRFARVGSEDSAAEDVDMGSALDEALANVAAAMKESRAILTRGPLPTVRARRAQLVRLLQNLLANAVKFRGKARLKIDVSAEEEDRRWRFSVRDNGIGFDPADYPRLFKMFSRLHPRGGAPGSGMGLALCRRIVEAHQGRIWAEGRSGRGAVFHFTIARGD